MPPPADGPPPPPESSMRSIALSAAARLLSFVPAALATFATSRLVISHFGIDAFDGFSLIIALIALIPLNDLGVGAAVTSAYAGDGPQSERGYRVTLTATRVLGLSSLVAAAGALAIAAFGAWPTLLGTASGPNGWTAAALVVFAVAFVPGLGPAMLLGIHRNHVTVYTQMLQAPLILAGVLVTWWIGAGEGPLLLVPAAALLVINWGTALLAGRATGISWTRLSHDVLAGRRRAPGASVRALAGPVLITSIATPIALQADRLVLSHVSTTAAVANYSVAVQIFAPALALIGAAASPLWPIWESARTSGRRGPSVGLVLLAFAGGATLLGAALAGIANPAAEIIGTGHLHLGVLLPVAGGLLVVESAVAWPIAMNMMDPAGARFTAVSSVIALPVNVALSVLLAQRYGAAGPLLATVVVVLVVQCMPGLLFIRRRGFTGRHGTNAASDSISVDMAEQFQKPARSISDVVDSAACSSHLPGAQKRPVDLQHPAGARLHEPPLEEPQLEAGCAESIEQRREQDLPVVERDE